MTPLSDLIARLREPRSERDLAAAQREAADRLERIEKAWAEFGENGTHDSGPEYQTLRRAITGDTQ